MMIPISPNSLPRVHISRISDPEANFAKPISDGKRGEGKWGIYILREKYKHDPEEAREGKAEEKLAGDCYYLTQLSLTRMTRKPSLRRRSPSESTRHLRYTNSPSPFNVKKHHPSAAPKNTSKYTSTAGRRKKSIVTRGEAERYPKHT